MQNKSAIWLFTILLVVACLYQLSFTWVASSVESEAHEKAIAQVDSLKAIKELSLFQSDSALQSFETENLLSKGPQEVYPLLGYNYNYVKKRELNLGLDLQGGMHVTLEVSVPDLIKSLAGANASDPNFKNILNRAIEMKKTSTDNFVTLFEMAHREVAPDYKLAAIFHNLETKDRIPPSATDDEVLTVVRSEAEEAINRTEQVLRKRVDNLGVVQPKIQRLTGTGRIVVELPGVKDKERVRKILQGTAKLEFFETYFMSEVGNQLFQANDLIRQTQELDSENGKDEAAEKVEADKADESIDTLADVDSDSASTSVDSSEVSLEDLISDSSTVDATDSLSIEEQRRQNPLFTLLQPQVQQGPNGMQFGQGPRVGLASAADTAEISRMLNRKDVKALFPPRTRFVWDAYTISKDFDVYALYALIVPKGGKALLEGDVVTDAFVSADEMGQPTVSMNMNPTGAKVWRDMTREAAADNNRSVAVVLDNLVYSAPSVQGEIPGGRTQINGQFTQQDASDLAGVLKAGKLPAPSHIIEEAVVGPSLGQEAIRSGLNSFLIALTVVLVYMIMFYSRGGMVADIALVSNLFFIMGFLASFHATLTLPGIAGIVLTIGMSVDANVLIYERIREELRSGKGVKQAVADGYSNAYSSILDANITTLLTGIILFIFGTGPIQGFATTLIIGILTSLFSAIFITRLVFEYLLEKKANVSFSTSMSENFLKGINIDFIGKRKMYYVISGVLILVSLGSLVTRGLNYGVDFTGGRSYIVRFEEPAAVNDVANAIADEFINEDGTKDMPEVKTFGASNQVKITSKYMIEDDGNDVDDIIEGKLFAALSKYYPEGTTRDMFTAELTSQKVEPTIADDIKEGALFAVVFALVVIFLYILVRFRKVQFSVGAIVAMVHDVIVTLGIFSLFYGVLPFSLEIDQAFIAAILTVVGYSINDTVVVFDRIREVLGLHPKHSLQQNTNEALNSTLSRTVNTSLTTFVVLLIIFIFGGEVIRGFIFALMIGVVVGTYSSVCVATPAMFDLMDKKLKK